MNIFFFCNHIPLSNKNLKRLLPFQSSFCFYPFDATAIDGYASIILLQHKIDTINTCSSVIPGKWQTASSPYPICTHLQTSTTSKKPSKTASWKKHRHAKYLQSGSKPHHPAMVPKSTGHIFHSRHRRSCHQVLRTRSIRTRSARVPQAVQRLPCWSIWQCLCTSKCIMLELFWNNTIKGHNAACVHIANASTCRRPGEKSAIPPAFWEQSPFASSQLSSRHLSTGQGWTRKHTEKSSRMDRARAGAHSLSLLKSVSAAYRANKSPKKVWKKQAICKHIPIPEQPMNVPTTHKIILFFTTTRAMPGVVKGACCSLRLQVTHAPQPL